MEITLEMVDQVRERTGATYEEAKKALEQANGNVVDAIIGIERENQVNIDIDVNEKVRSIAETIKNAVKEGNVNRIRVMHGEHELVNIPVNAGIAAGALGLALAPMAVFTTVVAGVAARYGFDCRFEIVKVDGAVDKVIEVNPNKQDDEKIEKADVKDENS